MDVPGEHQADVFAVVAFVKQGSNKDVFYREESDLVVNRRSAELTSVRLLASPWQ
jgi:hypothetical protein